MWNCYMTRSIPVFSKSQWASDSRARLNWDFSRLVVGEDPFGQSPQSSPFQAYPYQRKE